MYNSYIKNALYLAASAKRSWVDFVSCPLFANVFKNKIKNSETHIIVCLLKTE